jgi:hypothetical protein
MKLPGTLSVILAAASGHLTPNSAANAFAAAAPRVGLVLDVVDLGQFRPRGGLGRLGQRSEAVA